MGVWSEGRQLNVIQLTHPQVEEMSGDSSVGQLTFPWARFSEAPEQLGQQSTGPAKERPQEGEASGWREKSYEVPCWVSATCWLFWSA